MRSRAARALHGPVLLALAALAALAAACSSDGGTASGGVDPAQQADAAAGGGVDGGGTSSSGGSGDGGTGPKADSAPLYDPDVVPKFELTFDAAALAVLSSTAPADQKTWVHGAFKYGSVTFADVGVRRKGSSTFRALPQKAAFKIKFNKWVPGQKLLGLSEITLNNMVSDGTFLAERLAYHVFRAANLPAPRANSAVVTVNGESYGLYANVETPDKDLIERLFGAKAATLYEVDYGSEWTPGVEDGFQVDVGDPARPDVVALFQSVKAAQPATLLADVAAHLDTSAWLGYVAAEAAVGHYDGYAYGIYGSHNYFMAGDTDGVFRLIPWSTDLTFSDREVVVNAADLKAVGAGTTLIMRCKASAPCWDAYKQRVKQVLTTYESAGLLDLAKKWHAQIDPYVTADTKREESLDGYQGETEKLYAWIPARPALVRQQLGL